MPKSRDLQITFTHILADGRVLSDQEFGEFLIDPAVNEEPLRSFAIGLDPVFAATVRAQKRREATQARRE